MLSVTIERAVTMVHDLVEKSSEGVGCVIVDNDNGCIYGTGFATENRHAEEMAFSEISGLTKSFIFNREKSCTLFVNKLPCTTCARKIIEMGIGAIIITEERINDS